MLSALPRRRAHRRRARRGRARSSRRRPSGARAGRGARRTRRACAGCRERDAPAGFWDAVHAHVVADADPDDADDDVASVAPSPRRDPTPPALGVGGGVRGGRGRGGRGDRRPAPQRGVAERRRGGRAARRAGIRQRRSREHARARRSARRVPPVTMARPTGDARALRARHLRVGVADRGVGGLERLGRRAGGGAPRTRHARRRRRPRLRRHRHRDVGHAEGEPDGAGARDRHRRRGRDRRRRRRR